ncbi:ASCH domain-containing protein [Ruminococcus sp.]|uniref:ASCH domain-containing protein n=1 Tax=Ruminococcus sp. TaxID=41978 RepID=UPI0025F6A946|nr:ASCH domain-containing protein [Ruminococcus sp.]
MTHYMKLAPVPFEKIKNGRKTIELRLYDEKRRKVRVGDEIVFTSTADPALTLETRVTALHIFKDFAALYRELPLEKCGYDEADIANASPADMEGYYSPERQREYGVAGIELMVCK